jgi:hypothetical protein
MSNELEKGANELAQYIKDEISKLSKEEILKQVLTPKYAKLVKDFTKEQILKCLFVNEE